MMVPRFDQALMFPREDSKQLTVTHQRHVQPRASEERLVFFKLPPYRMTPMSVQLFNGRAVFFFSHLGEELLGRSAVFREAAQHDAKVSEPQRSFEMRLHLVHLMTIKIEGKTIEINSEERRKHAKAFATMGFRGERRHVDLSCRWLLRVDVHVLSAGGYANKDSP